MMMNPGIILAGRDPTDMVTNAQKIPANALAMQGQQMALDQARQQQMEVAAGKLAKMVMTSGDPASAYPKALAAARKIGIDVSGFPDSYTPEVGEALSMIGAVAGMDKAAKHKLEAEVEMMRKAGYSEEDIRKAVGVRMGIVPRATGAPDPNKGVPSGYRRREDGNLEYIPGGPADPALKGGVKPPAGYRFKDDGGLEYIPGGPADPVNRSGESITVGPDSVTIERGPGLSKTTRTEIEKRELDSRDTLARLDRINAAVVNNPDIVNLGTFGARIKTDILEFVEKAGASLSDEDKKFLTDITTARGDILENLNYTIKAITGAAMTEAEAKRIGATLPGINEGPTVFKAKLERATDSVRMAVARYNYWRANGMNGKPEDVTTLSDMKRIMRERAAELSKTMTPEQASAQFFKEFGI